MGYPINLRVRLEAFTPEGDKISGSGFQMYAGENYNLNDIAKQMDAEMNMFLALKDA